MRPRKGSAVADISIGIAADTRAAATGIKSGVLEPLEDVDKALDRVGRSGEELESDLVGAFQGSQRATKDLARENKELADVIQAEARKSSRAIKNIDDEGLTGFRDGVRGAKEEAVQNFSEVASSFDGTVQGISDGVQGTLGGLATAISGPIGLALGGLGIVAGTVGAAWATRAEEIEQRWQDMYDDMVESGQNFVTQDFINTAISDIASDQGKVNAAVEEGRTIQESYLTVIRAQAGDMDALRAVLTSARGELEQQNAAQAAFIEQNGDESASIADKQGALELLIEKYERAITATDGAASAASIARRAMEESTVANHGTADSLDRVTNSANAVPSGKTVVITADTAAYYAAAEAIRRDKIMVSVGFEALINQHRGRTIP
jgi:hypothetical protein